MITCCMLPTQLLAVSAGEKWHVQMVTGTADFLDKRPLPNPIELSSAARAQLVVSVKSVRYGTAS